VSAAPDVAGLLAALVELPDRTPQQLRAYAVQADTWAAGAPYRDRGPNGDCDPDED
jgi:hypothetical protein